jgi:hypothetical protein
MPVNEKNSEVRKFVVQSMAVNLGIDSLVKFFIEGTNNSMKFTVLLNAMVEALLR